MVLDMGVNSVLWNIVSLVLTLPAILWLYNISRIVDSEYAKGWRTCLYAVAIFAAIQAVLIIENAGFVSAYDSQFLRLPLRLLFPLVLVIGFWQQRKAFYSIFDHKVRDHKRRRRK